MVYRSSRRWNERSGEDYLWNPTSAKWLAAVHFYFICSLKCFYMTHVKQFRKSEIILISPHHKHCGLIRMWNYRTTRHLCTAANSVDKVTVSSLSMTGGMFEDFSFHKLESTSNEWSRTCELFPRSYY